MDTSAKISCCKTCLLAENMKDCKVCQFNAGLEIVTVTKSAWQIEAEAQAADYAEDYAMRNDLYNMGMGA